MNIGLKCDNMTYTAKYDTILYIFVYVLQTEI